MAAARDSAACRACAIAVEPALMADCANAIPLGVEAASRLGEAINAALAAAGTLQSTCCSPAGLLATATSLRPSSAKNRPAIFVTSLSPASLCLVTISCSNLPSARFHSFSLFPI